MGSRFLGAARLALLTLQEWGVVFLLTCLFVQGLVTTGTKDVAILWLSIFGFERRGRACHEQFGVFLGAVMYYSF